MELVSVREIILSLRAAQEERNLSVSDVKSLVDTTGYIISESTYRRIFVDEIEEDTNFNYETILRPIAKVLFRHDAEQDEIIQTSFEGYEAILRYKADVIASLKEQIEHLKEEHERHCDALERHMETLRKQIELKDARMDRKDNLVEKLLGKLL